MMRAIALRDRKAEAGAELDAAASVWHEASQAARNKTLGEGVYQVQDVLAAGGADLNEAVSLLTAGAMFFARLAPPPLTPPGTVPTSTHIQPRTPRFVRDMAMDMGADRSIAAALPVLLRDPRLCAR
jgi:hypothetical protein